MELLPTKRTIPSLDRALNSRVMLKPNFKSSSDTAKDMKLPYIPDRAVRGGGGEGMGVTITDMVVTGSGVVSGGGGELETMEVEGTVVVGCAGVGEISVVTTNVVNEGVDTMEVALDGKTEVEVESTAEEGAGVSCTGGDDSGTMEMEVLMLDVDGDGVGDAGVDIMGITVDCDGGGRGGGGGGSGSVVMVGEGDGNMEVSVVTIRGADDVGVSTGKELDGIGRVTDVLSSGDVGEGDGEGGSDGGMITDEDGAGG